MTHDDPTADLARTNAGVATTTERAIEPVRVAVSRVEPADCTADDILGMLDFVKAVKQALAGAVHELESEAKSKAMEFIDANGPIVSGTKVWKVGFETDTWTDDNTAVLGELLALGDLSFVGTCFASAAWKPGACRKALPAEVFDRLFRTEKRRKLNETEPKRKLLEVDTAFVR